MMSLWLIYTPVTPLVSREYSHCGAIVERETVAVREKLFPAPECAIVFVVSCLAFRFVSPLVTRRVSLSLSLLIHVYYPSLIETHRGAPRGVLLNGWGVSVGPD